MNDSDASMQMVSRGRGSRDANHSHRDQENGSHYRVALEEDNYERNVENLPRDNNDPVMLQNHIKKLKDRVEELEEADRFRRGKVGFGLVLGIAAIILFTLDRETNLTDLSWSGLAIASLTFTCVALCFCFFDFLSTMCSKH